MTGLFRVERNGSKFVLVHVAEGGTPAESIADAVQAGRSFDSMRAAISHATYLAAKKALGG